jgi:hypothetical protein
VDPVGVVPLMEQAVDTDIAVQAVLHHVEVVRGVQVIPAGTAALNYVSVSCHVYSNLAKCR